MHRKPAQRAIRYIQPSLAVLISALIVQVQTSNTIAAQPPVSPVSSVGKPSNAIHLAQQGKEFYAAEQFSEAVKAWQLAAQAFQSQGNTLNQAQALNHLSLTHQQLGSYSEATKAIAQSLKLLQHQGSSKEQLKILAQALNIQGQLQLAQGQAEQAVTTWQRATTTYTQADDQTGFIGSSINLAAAQQSLGLYRRALVTLNSVHKTLRSTPDSPLKAIGLDSLGNALRMVGDLDQSRQVLQQSLSLAQHLKSSQDIADALFSLGNTALAQQDTKAALVFYQQAMEASPSLFTRTQAQLNQLSLLVEPEQMNAAEIALRQRKPHYTLEMASYQKSQKRSLSFAAVLKQSLLPQISSQIASLPPSRTAVYARINFAQSLTRLKRSSSTTSSEWSEIAEILAAAVQQAKSLGDPRAEAYALANLGGLYEQTRQWSDAQKLTRQALVLASAMNAPEISYRVQWQLGRLLKAQGDTSGAVAAYTEAVNNLKTLRTDLAAINPEIQFSFRDGVEPVYRQLVDLLLQSEGGSQPTQKNLVQARNVIESLQLAELDNFFRVACLQGKAVQIDSVVDKDDPTAAVVYPIILKDRIEVILKLPQQPLRHYKTAVDQGEVEKILQELRQKLTQPYTYTLREANELSKQVHDWLIQPASPDLAKSKIKTLVFVLDGSLRNIPMAALYDGKQYLVEKYAVALTPGLQLLPPKTLERGQMKALTAGLSEARGGFSALTNVTLELKQIKSEVSSTVLLNQKFTSTALRNEINSRPFPVVHLATHGQFSSRADKTFILAWDKPININELNNILQTREQSLSSAIELLVLSACETAEGDKRAALGLAGVAVRAGARSTLASLWAIEDESSALLMGEFYRQLDRSLVNKAQALRLAQLELMKYQQWQHPRFWGSFELVGNWL